MLKKFLVFSSSVLILLAMVTTIILAEPGEGQSGRGNSSSGQRGRPTSISVKSEDNVQKQRINLRSTDRSLILDNTDDVVQVSRETSTGAEQELTELEDGDEVELESETGKLEGLSLKSKGSKFVLAQEGVEAVTKFPLSIDLETNELIVTTPAGVKRVAVLPQQAIENMIRVGHVDVILPQPSADPSASPEPSVSPEPTESATPSSSIIPSPSPLVTEEEFGNVEIVEENGEVLYVADGVKNKKLFGVFNVQVRKKVKLSASTGQVVDIDQTLGSRILDIFSF